MRKYINIIFILSFFISLPLLSQKPGKDIVAKTSLYDTAIPNFRIYKEGNTIKYEILKDRSTLSHILYGPNDKNYGKLFWSANTYFKIKEQSQLLPSFVSLNKGQNLFMKELNLYKQFKNDAYNNNILNLRNKNANETYPLFEEAYNSSTRDDIKLSAACNMAFLSYALGNEEVWNKSISFLKQNEYATKDYEGTAAKYYAKHDPFGIISLRASGWLLKNKKAGIGIVKTAHTRSTAFYFESDEETLKTYDDIEVKVNMDNYIQKVEEKNATLISNLYIEYLPAQFSTTTSLQIIFKNKSERIVTMQDFVTRVKAGDKEIFLNKNLKIDRLMPDDSFTMEIPIKDVDYSKTENIKLNIFDLPIKFDADMGHVIKKGNPNFSFVKKEKEMMEEWYVWMGNTKDFIKSIDESGVKYP